MIDLLHAYIPATRLLSKYDLDITTLPERDDNEGKEPKVMYYELIVSNVKETKPLCLVSIIGPATPL